MQGRPPGRRNLQPVDLPHLGPPVSPTEHTTIARGRSGSFEIVTEICLGR